VNGFFPFSFSFFFFLSGLVSPHQFKICEVLLSFSPASTRVTALSFLSFLCTPRLPSSERFPFSLWSRHLTLLCFLSFSPPGCFLYRAATLPPQTGFLSPAPRGVRPPPPPELPRPATKPFFLVPPARRPLLSSSL